VVESYSFVLLISNTILSCLVNKGDSEVALDVPWLSDCLVFLLWVSLVLGFKNSFIFHSVFVLFAFLFTALMSKASILFFIFFS
jgi:hypothetical protein